jgi:hypothetical protein
MINMKPITARLSPAAAALLAVSFIVQLFWCMQVVWISGETTNRKGFAPVFVAEWNVKASLIPARRSGRCALAFLALVFSGILTLCQV